MSNYYFVLPVLVEILHPQNIDVFTRAVINSFLKHAQLRLKNYLLYKYRINFEKQLTNYLDGYILIGKKEAELV